MQGPRLVRIYSYINIINIFIYDKDEVNVLVKIKALIERVKA